MPTGPSTMTAQNVESNIGALPLQDYRRYGRQMIIDGLGLPGKLLPENAPVFAAI